MHEHAPPPYTADQQEELCLYCHASPPNWLHIGNEKVCGQCGTRVYNSSADFPPKTLLHKENK